MIKKFNWKFLVLVIDSAVFFFILFFYLTQIPKEHKTDSRQISTVELPKENRVLPLRLKIPEINIDIAIESVGITPYGEMEVPANTQDAGWFGLGAIPGQKGSAVIAGHFDGGEGQKGVFSDLDKLKMGDKLYIENTDKTITTFVVRRSHIYDPGYAEEVFGQSDTAHLNLITCDGVWQAGKKSYTKRLVVFTDMYKTGRYLE